MFLINCVVMLNLIVWNRTVYLYKMYLVLQNPNNQPTRIGRDDSYDSNKRFSSRFRADSWVRHKTPEEDRRTFRPKLCDYYNKDKVNSSNILSNDNNQASVQRFWEIIFSPCWYFSCCMTGIYILNKVHFHPFLMSCDHNTNVMQASRVIFIKRKRKEKRFSLNGNGIMSSFLGRQFYRSTLYNDIDTNTCTLVHITTPTLQMPPHKITNT